MTQKQKWLSFFSIAFGLFTAVMDASMIGIALPSISKDFSLDLSSAAWISLVSTITVVAVLLPMGNISDRLGRKKIYLFGVVVMAAGSLFSSFSNEIFYLLIFRIIVSIGAAMRMSTGLAMVMMIFKDKERGKGLGANTTTVGLAAITGPIFGGFLVGSFGWESIFITQAFLSIPVFILGYIFLDKNVVDLNQDHKKGKFDFSGSILSALAFSVLLFTINYGLVNMSYIVISLSFIITIILFILFVFVESKSDQPILNVTLLKNKNFMLTMGTRLLGFLSGSSTLFLMPFYIQLVKGIDPEKAGLIIFPGALGMSITASFSGRLSDKYGEKPFVILGLTIILISSFLFSLFNANTSTSLIIIVLMIHGLGMGIWGTPNSSQTVSIVPKNTYGSVAALINLIRTVGMGVSIAISSSLITLSFIGLGLNSDFSSVKESFSVEQSTAFLEGFKTTYYVLMSICIVSILLALITRISNKDKV
jgi:EmrB/QacA subfamily drug resistance transporter